MPLKMLNIFKINDEARLSMYTDTVFVFQNFYSCKDVNIFLNKKDLIFYVLNILEFVWDK